MFKHDLRFRLSNPRQIPIISLLTQSQTFLFKAIRAYRFSVSFKFAHLSSARILIQVMYITFTFQCRRSFFAKELILNCRLVSPGPTFEEAATKKLKNSKYQKWKNYFRIFKNKNHAAVSLNFWPQQTLYIFKQTCS